MSYVKYTVSLPQCRIVITPDNRIVYQNSPEHDHSTKERSMGKSRNMISSPLHYWPRYSPGHTAFEIGYLAKLQMCNIRLVIMGHLFT